MLRFSVRRSVLIKPPQYSHRLRRPLLVLFAALSITTVAAASGQLHSAAAQTGGNEIDCDGHQCIIWGLQAGNILLKINTCTGTVAAAPLAGPAVNTIAAGQPAPLGWPNLQYGDGAGGLWCTNGFPPSPW